MDPRLEVTLVVVLLLAAIPTVWAIADLSASWLRVRRQRQHDAEFQALLREMDRNARAAREDLRR